MVGTSSLAPSVSPVLDSCGRDGWLWLPPPSMVLLVRLSIGDIGLAKPFCSYAGPASTLNMFAASATEPRVRGGIVGLRGVPDREPPPPPRLDGVPAQVHLSCQCCPHVLVSALLRMHHESGLLPESEVMAMVLCPSAFWCWAHSNAQTSHIGNTQAIET